MNCKIYKCDGDYVYFEDGKYEIIKNIANTLIAKAPSHDLYSVEILGSNANEVKVGKVSLYQKYVPYKNVQPEVIPYDGKNFIVKGTVDKDTKGFITANAEKNNIAYKVIWNGKDFNLDGWNKDDNGYVYYADSDKQVYETKDFSGDNYWSKWYEDKHGGEEYYEYIMFENASTDFRGPGSEYIGGGETWGDLISNTDNEFVSGLGSIPMENIDGIKVVIPFFKGEVKRVTAIFTGEGTPSESVELIGKDGGWFLNMKSTSLFEATEVKVHIITGEVEEYDNRIEVTVIGNRQEEETYSYPIEKDFNYDAYNSEDGSYVEDIKLDNYYSIGNGRKLKLTSNTFDDIEWRPIFKDDPITLYLGDYEHATLTWNEEDQAYYSDPITDSYEINHIGVDAHVNYLGGQSQTFRIEEVGGE